MNTVFLLQSMLLGCGVVTIILASIIVTLINRIRDILKEKSL